MAICFAGVISQVISTLAPTVKPSTLTRAFFSLFFHRFPASLYSTAWRRLGGWSVLCGPRAGTRKPSRRAPLKTRRGMIEDERDRWRRGERRVKAATEKAIRNNEDEMGCRALPTFSAALLLGQSLLGSRRNSRYVRIFGLDASVSHPLTAPRLIHPIETILHLTRRCPIKTLANIVETNFHVNTVFVLLIYCTVRGYRRRYWNGFLGTDFGTNISLCSTVFYFLGIFRKNTLFFAPPIFPSFFKGNMETCGPPRGMSFSSFG